MVTHNINKIPKFHSNQSIQHNAVSLINMVQWLPPRPKRQYTIDLNSCFLNCTLAFVTPLFYVSISNTNFWNFYNIFILYHAKTHLIFPATGNGSLPKDLLATPTKEGATPAIAGTTPTTTGASSSTTGATPTIAGVTPNIKGATTPTTTGAPPSATDSEETEETDSSKSMGSYHLEQLTSTNGISPVEEENGTAPGSCLNVSFPLG